MSQQGLPMWQCVQCGRTRFPPRELCPRCGTERGRLVRARYGDVVEYTHLGQPADAVLASIRTELGPIVIARLNYPDVHNGHEVELGTAQPGPHSPARYGYVPVPEQDEPA
ncbi:rubredoxin-like zinc ribbon protein [Tamaricihabitans halophyticus]|uniref:Rubredoxin-like zinc ribbon protein n=1 Tax=Tamaricihabitans halophyticus TaxID=1262583 RepID=A0A4R2QZD4_9PSEU|nr:zinc ribbon domain-containing protein [Tamaricihabitans halophyticus]TCP55047.1 rubredoxin-like zinc ribbon protein [Tamaricihabitans halophyticus]